MILSSLDVFVVAVIEASLLSLSMETLFTFRTIAVDSFSGDGDDGGSTSMGVGSSLVWVVVITVEGGFVFGCCGVLFLLLVVAVGVLVV